jgi:hypothetical protein
MKNQTADAVVEKSFVRLKYDRPGPDEDLKILLLASSEVGTQDRTDQVLDPFFGRPRRGDGMSFSLASRNEIARLPSEVECGIAIDISMASNALEFGIKLIIRSFWIHMCWASWLVSAVFNGPLGDL